MHKLREQIAIEAFVVSAAVQNRYPWVIYHPSEYKVLFSPMKAMVCYPMFRDSEWQKYIMNADENIALNGRQ